MSTHRLPDFEHTLAQSPENLGPSELAECHGVVCGLLCRDTGVSLDAFIELLGILDLVKAPAAGFRTILDELLICTAMQLVDEDMSLSLWLPADNETLEDRTMALSQWCNGFIAALGSGGHDPMESMSDDAREAMQDLQQISAADVTDTDESEEDENAFTEIVEYLRVVILMIREDMQVHAGQGLIH